MANKIYEMFLDEGMFNKVLSGEKTIELRILDDKRRNIELCDYIIFSNRSNSDELIPVKVKGLYYSTSFEELLSDINIGKTGLSPIMPSHAAGAYMRYYYSEEKEKENGVLGIKIERVSIESLLAYKGTILEQIQEDNGRFTKEEKELLSYRLGITTGTPKSTEEVAEKYGVSSEVVKQLVGRLMRKDGDKGAVVRNHKIKGFLD